MRSLLVVTAVTVASALAACAAVPVGHKDLLAFLQEPGVSRHEVVNRLGAPSDAFDNCRVLTYRIAQNDSGYYIVAQEHNAMRGIKEGVPYDAVITFDDQGIVQKFNVAPVQYPPVTSTKSGPSVPVFIKIGSTRREEVLLELGDPDGTGRAQSWFWYGSGYRGGYAPSIAHDRDSLLATLRRLEAPRLLVGFNDDGVVESAAILPAACWETKSEACEQVTRPAPEAVAMTATPVPVPADMIQQYDNLAIAVTGSWVSDDWVGGYACHTSTGGERPESDLQRGRLIVTGDALLFEFIDGAGTLSTSVATVSVDALRIPWSEVAAVAVYEPPRGSGVGIPILDVIVAISEDSERAKVASWLQVQLKDHSCVFAGGPDAAGDFNHAAVALMRPLVAKPVQACATR